MNKLETIFGTKKPIIGVIHLSPLLGFAGFDGINNVLDMALTDLNEFEKGQISGIIIENNYDLPHKINVSPETIASMTFIVTEISKRTNLPIGLSVLWNDYKAALSIAKVTSAKFVRIPVFVDRVITDFGEIIGEPDKVIEYRTKISADDIALFVDIQVKHARMFEPKPLYISAKQAILAKADALIITGKWTGDAPSLERLKEVRDYVEDFPILIGSGASKENIVELLNYADGAIVSTSLKTGEKLSPELERNLKPFYERIDHKKVIELMRSKNGV
jgi:membrane complex biogenesis BtpA family protein